MSESYHTEDEVQQRSYDTALMRRLLVYLRPYRVWVIIAVLLLLAVAVAGNVSPLLIMRAVDFYVNSPERAQAEAGGATAALANILEKDAAGLWRMTLLLAALVMLEAGLRYVQLLAVALIGQRTLLTMRMDVFKHLQRLSLRFLDRNPVGRLMARVTNDVEKIQQSIVTGVVQIVSDLLTMIVVLGFMLVFNWQLTLLMMIPVPFVFATSFIFRRYAHRTFLAIQKKVARLSAFLQENITGMRVVQLFGRERQAAEKFRRLNADHRDEWIRQVRYFAVYFPVVEFLGSFATALVILYCGWKILDTGVIVSGTASVGTIFGYVFWAERFFGPIRALADRYNLLLEAMASSERIFQLLDTPLDIEDKPGAREIRQIQGDVEFRDVRFQYEPEQPVLKGVSFKVAPGERVAVVGHTGAGKSTLINLLARFYDVDGGAVCIDGVDVRDYAQDALRANIGIVLQDVFLFSGTVGDNIRLGDPNITEETIREKAAHVNAASFIERLTGKYDYDVGERGCNLSTGQRQLLAFARTLAHEPRILVLDEATSNIDSETEALIQDAIEKLMAGRTCIVIAHRLSTIRNADRILVMHHGELRESGTHQELLAKGGIYKTLYELQYKEQDAPVA